MIINNVLGIASGLILSTASVFALEVGDGLTLFNKSPRLVDTVTTLSRIRVDGAEYYFTLELPENVGEPLQKLIIQQNRGEDKIYFALDETYAFEGKPINRGNALSIARVKRNLDNNKISIIFEPPIPPGKTFTVGFKPKKNPDISGVYYFGVTAYPFGQNPQGLYLGPGRLQFYQQGDRFP
ncbi:MAG: DUF2808 domain-containing protein [Cyanobacteria bacterium P01_G01_bin.49]